MSDERTIRQFATLLRCGAAENVVYNGTRTIKAIVDRQGTDGISAPGNPLRPHIVATVLNDSVNGVSRTELSRSDTITIPTLAGGTSTSALSIVGPLDGETDNQIMTLELR